MISLLVFSSGGGKPTAKGNVELTWWNTFEDDQNVQQLIQDYQQAHPNVTINYVKKDVATYENDLVNAFADGNGPDILSIHNDWLPQQMSRLAPMPEGMMSVRTFNDTFANVVSDDFVKDDKIYAIPLNLDVLALFYNEDILGTSGISSPPKTWTELETDVEKITKQDRPGNFVKSGVAMGVSGNVNRAVDIVSLLMLQNGTQMYSSDYSNATFSDGGEGSPGYTALQYFTQFADPSKRSYTWNAKADNSVDAFTQNKLGMMLSYYYMEPQIMDKGPNINWKVSAAPQISDDPQIKVNFANYWGQAVSKYSQNSDVAWDFINFITSKDELNKYYGQHKLISSRKDILNDQIQDTDIGVFAENALTAKSVYKKDADGFETIFSKMIDDVSIQGLPTEQAIDNAAQQIDQQLQQ